MDLGWAQSPDEKTKKKQLYEFITQEKKILHKNTKIQRLKKECSQIFEYIDNNITHFEKTLNNQNIADRLTTTPHNNI